MTIMKEIPEGEYCYSSGIFSDNISCPDLDDTVTLSPKCTKYNEALSWTVLGRILKCDKCKEVLNG